MLSVKVKVEKPDLEAASARSRLDAVLQGLLERREPLEEAGKAPGDAHNKEASPSVPGKRPPGRFPQRSRKKRREGGEGPDPAHQRHSTYVIKLFDRSVELGQFSPGAPLYPVCRAWMRNRPTPTPPTPPPAPQRDGAAAAPPGQTPPGTPRGEGTAGNAGKGEDIYELPPPAPPRPPRIPSPLGPDEGEPPPDQLPDPAPSMSSLIYKNMERWKRVRQRWREAGLRQQQRYGASLRLLRLIYERQ